MTIPKDVQEKIEDKFPIQTGWNVQDVSGIQRHAAAVGYTLAAHQLEEKEKEIETLRLQLAGCGVAALGNTEEARGQRIGGDNPYWSASYGDVCDAVDREIKYRELHTLTESQRQSWADMCIKKQARIEELTNLLEKEFKMFRDIDRVEERWQQFKTENNL